MSRLISRLMISMSRRLTAVSPDFKAHQHVLLLTDVADLAGYDEPGTASKDLDPLHIARE